jgi:hypothetical protein
VGAVKRCPCDTRTINVLKAMGLRNAAGQGTELEGAWYPAEAACGLTILHTAVGEIPRLDANKFVVSRIMAMTNDINQPPSAMVQQLLYLASVLESRVRYVADNL